MTWEQAALLQEQKVGMPNYQWLEAERHRKSTGPETRPEHKIEGTSNSHHDFVFGPHANRKDAPRVVQICEAGVAHPAQQLRAGRRIAANLAAALDDLSVPARNGHVWRHRAVFRVVLNVEVLELGPAAWRRISVDGQQFYFRAT